MATKLQTTKAKINKCGYNKLKSFHTAQKQQNEEVTLEWENICANLRDPDQWKQMQETAKCLEPNE